MGCWTPHRKWLSSLNDHFIHPMTLQNVTTSGLRYHPLSCRSATLFASPHSALAVLPSQVDDAHTLPKICMCLETLQPDTLLCSPAKRCVPRLWRYRHKT